MPVKLIIPDDDELPEGEPVSGQSYRKDGWRYCYMEGAVTHEDWDLFMTVVGMDAHCRVIGFQFDEKLAHGQFVISQEGLAAWEAYERRGGQDA